VKAEAPVPVEAERVDAGVPVRALLVRGQGALADAGLPTARPDAEHLLAELLGAERLALYTAALGVPEPIARRYRELIARRAAGEPLQYLLGWTEFGGLRIRVGPGALIPRPETEGLVAWSLELAPPGATVCDLGTGTGCIACAIAALRPDVTVAAVERSAAALELAADNVRAHGLNPRVTVLSGDLFAALAPRARLDLVVANPPYIPTGLLASLPREVRDWEPRDALDGGPDGMDVHRRIVAGAPRALREGGALLMEVGDGQAPAVASALDTAGFVGVRTRRDLSGMDRYVAGWLRAPGVA
jgi:release factor glutamine methyltransferase